MADDWDLHAVVRGCTTNSSASCSTSTNTATTFISTNTTPPCENTHLSYGSQQDGNFLYMQDLYRSGGSLEDLNDLYKPFFPKSSPPLSPRSIPISPLSVLGGLPDLSQQVQQIHHQQQQQISKPKQNFSLVGPCRNKPSHPPNSRPKRRKNQMKRVIEMPAEALSSDMWSWRKYGQKPIKGSPYPRGYYRCSTSKGCSARKQVERNRSDPGIFIVTYTAEHNHPMPTHRNSLAGSSRQKPSTSSGEPNKPSNSSPPVSPSVGDSPELEKMEIESCKDDIIEEDDENMIDGREMNLDDDDFFEGLDELEAAIPAGISSSFSQKIELPWLTNSAATTAAGGV